MRQRHTTLLALMIVLLVLAGCGGNAPSTPYPTPAPLPTYTPYPTWTPAAPASGPAETDVEGEAPLESGAVDAPAEPTPTTASAAAVSLEPVILIEYEPREIEVLARINEWRMSIGEWPVRLNPELTALAQAQADYLSGFANLPDDVHARPDGTLPLDLLRNTGWPSYNTRDQIEGGEVAYVGASATSATDWWFNSDIHRRTIENDAFREVGIGIANHPWGTVFIMLFASKPNELTVLYEPQTHRVYISEEEARYASTGDFFRTPTQFQFVGSIDAPTVNEHWMPYHHVVDAPDNRDYFTVVVTDGEREARFEINTWLDVAWLPATYPKDGIVTGIPTDALRSSATLFSHADEEVTTYNAAVTYHVERLIVHNSSHAPVDFTDVRLRAADGSEVKLADWAVFMSPGISLDAVPPGTCFILFNNTDTFPGSPEECLLTASVVSLAPERIFWNEAAFDVIVNGTSSATCLPNVGSCAFGVPHSE